MNISKKWSMYVVKEILWQLCLSFLPPETLEYLYSTYIDTLQTKMERQEARFRGNRLCPSPINSLPGSPRSMHIPVPVTTGVNSAGIAQTITGEICSI